MGSLPREPEAFAETVATMLRQLQPGYAVDLIGPRELIVNGRRLDLENLYRMVAHDPGRGDEIVEQFLDQLFSGESLMNAESSFELARPRIMPRIQPESIFEHLNRELVAHVPFVNDTVIVFVTDLPQMTVSITTDQVLRWGTTVEDLETIARENLLHYTDDIEIQIVESKEGGRAAIISEQDGYDAARLLMGNLHDRLSRQLGGDFLVAIPARDMFVAISNDPPEFVERIGQRVEQDYKRLPYPITSRLFLATRDGVAGTMQRRTAA